MATTAVRIQGLSKQYTIGRLRERHPTLRDQFTKMISAPMRRLRGQSNDQGPERTIWALSDVNLEINRGEVVGVIGHNGAGKSTLLKILSRITEPTLGSVEIRGRVSSLLEVGTGFHPELSGRENIFLNGSVLSMKRKEIDRKFDEIVEFSGVEEFIDTPVKHYSTGMQLRLAFAVAAHLEPEVLIVDEVLAVGDAAFQQKCLGKIGDIAQTGRTILFVSHSMESIISFCSRACLIKGGKLVADGIPSDVVGAYLSPDETVNGRDLQVHSGRRHSRVSALRRVTLLSKIPRSNVFNTQGPFGFSVECEVPASESANLSLGFSIKDGMGRQIHSSTMKQYGLLAPNNGKVEFVVSVDALCLTAGTYSVSLWLGNGAMEFDTVENAIQFQVVWASPDGVQPPNRSWGPLFMPVRWQFGSAIDSRQLHEANGSYR